MNAHTFQSTFEMLFSQTFIASFVSLIMVVASPDAYYPERDAFVREAYPEPNMAFLYGRSHHTGPGGDGYVAGAIAIPDHHYAQYAEAEHDAVPLYGRLHPIVVGRVGKWSPTVPPRGY
ncbi:hypothetical protein MMC18_006146 [Xylographa bjoerkii]|nr:hypothetical protein [Xylographa bjoerkii]